MNGWENGNFYDIEVLLSVNKSSGKYILTNHIFITEYTHKGIEK